MKARFILLFIMAVIIGCQPDDYTPQSSNTGNTTSDGNSVFRAVVPEGSFFTWDVSDQVLLLRGETSISKAVSMKVNPETYTSKDVELYSDENLTAGTVSDKNVAIFGTVSRDLVVKEKSVTAYVDVDGYRSYTADGLFHSDFPMIAVTDLSETNLTFSPVFGILKMDLKGSDMSIKSLTLRGGNSETICGTFAFKFEKENIYTSVVDGANTGKSITLNCSTPVQLSNSQPTSFYFALPAGKYSNGFVLDIETEEGTAEQTVSTSFTIARDSVSDIGEIEIDLNAGADYWSDQLDAIVAKYGFNVQNSSNITPMGTHFEKFKAATEDQKTSLATATYEPRKLAEFPDWTLVTKNVNLYPYGQPSPADVVQHTISNCCFLAVLGSLAQSYPEFIKNIITYNSDNTYTVKMYDPMGNQLDVCVTPSFYYTAANKVGGVTGNNGVHTWASILEKALMKYETVFNCDPIAGINPSPSLAPFVGDGTIRQFGIKKISKEDMSHVVEVLQRNGYIMTGGFRENGYVIGTAKTVTLHEYSCLLCPDDEYLFTLRNPWGFATGGTPRGNGCMDIPWDPYLFTEGNIYLRVLNPGNASPYFIGADELVPYEKPF